MLTVLRLDSSFLEAPQAGLLLPHVGWVGKIFWEAVGTNTPPCLRPGAALGGRPHSNQRARRG